MYNIKGPSKIVTKTTTRRGISQNYENYRENNKNRMNERDENETANVPKLTFNKKYPSNVEPHQNITPQHEEIVNFIYDSWTSVCSELERENSKPDPTSKPPSQQKTHTTHYYEDEPCTALQDFKPFDLEAWWGRRLYAYITNAANMNS